MKDIKFNLTPNDFLTGTKVNEELRSIDENFKELESDVNVSITSTFTTTLPVSNENSFISGSEFTPPLLSEPRIIQCFKDYGEGGILRVPIELGYIYSDPNYNIIIGEITEELTEVKINVQF